MFTGRDRLHGIPGEFTVVRCRTCDLMRTNPRPTPETIGLHYPEDYGPYQGTLVAGDGAAGSARPSPLVLARRLVKKLIKRDASRLPALAPGHMLEIGCASGSFLHQMAASGWKVEGIEFSPQAAQEARALGYSVFTGQLEDAPDPDHPFDLVVGWMVLEHLHDPMLCLKKLHNWTSPGAYLVVSVPNAGAFERRLFKNAWYALDLPRHLYHFTPQTIARVLGKGGWRMERVIHHRTVTNLVASLGYAMRDRKVLPRQAEYLIKNRRLPGKWNALLYPAANVLGMLGHTGRMTVWAKRKD